MTDCIICAYPIDNAERLPTLTICSHAEPICSICFLRIRSLQRQFHCPTCKRELDAIICCAEPGRQFGDFTVWGESIGPDFTYDQLSQMFFPKDYYRTRVETLRQIKCSVCPATRRDFRGLRGHLTNEHNLHLCMLCVENKQVFPAEQRIYTKAEYDRHVRCGDNDGSIGHPNCEFCRTRFYDSTALFMHLNKEHYTCFLCEQQGIKFKYFHTYNHLESHFRKEHFLCEEKSCVERRFMAFGNEIDYRAHLIAFHPHLSINRTIPLQFKLRRASDTAGGGGNSSSGDAPEGDGSEQAQTGSAGSDQRFEGGLGGRANQGVWQLELAPISSDPRDPDRNLQALTPSAATETIDDFPALPSTGGGTLISNRWINTSVRGAGGSSGSAKTKGPAIRPPGVGGSRSAADFPALPDASTSSKKAKGTGKVGLLSPVPTSGSRAESGAAAGRAMNYSQAMEIEKEVAGLGAGASASTASRGNDLGGWPVRVDKRLAKKSAVSTTSSASTPSTPAGETASGATGRQNRPVVIGGGGWARNEMFTAGDIYEAELANALQESLAMYSGNPKKPDKLDDEEAYPSLPFSSTPATTPVTVLSSQNNGQAGKASAQRPASGRTSASKPSAAPAAAAKKPASAAHSSDWSQALKSVGMELPTKKKKKGAGLTVIPMSKPAGSK